MNKLYYILILLLLLLITQKKNNIIEIFQQPLTNEPILNRKISYINIPKITIYKNEDDDINQLLKNNNNNLNLISFKTENNIKNIDNKEHSLYYTDAYTYSKKYKDYKILTICPTHKYLILVSNKRIKLISDNSLNIGYLNENDKHLFQIIIKSQINYTNLDNYNFVKIEKNEIIDKLFNLKNLDIFIYFNSINNPLFNKLIKQNDFNLVSYNYKISELEFTTDIDEKIKISGGDSENSLDENLLKFYLPFYKKKIQIISREKDNSNDNNNFNYNTILIDTLLFSFNDDTEGKTMNLDKFKELYIYILNYFNQFLKINYYLQHFDFLKISEEWSLNKQKNGKFKNVMEKFKSLEFKINKKDLIAINLKNDVVTYKFNKLLINGIPLKVGDTLYSEINTGNESIISKIIGYEPYVKTKITDNIKKYQVIKIDYKYVYVNEINDKEDIINLENNNFEPLYRCYQDSSITSKAECIDTTDKTDIEKPSYNWDRPCNKNTECPFYLSNKNYLNERGGCNNGYCEFPIGIKRKSYREYDDKYTENNHPKCLGCGINDSKDCCDKQQKSSKTKGSKYKSADYIFKNDSEDRRLSKFF